VQRYCDGCRRFHDLEAFDLDRDEANAVCREHSRPREKATKSRRLRQSKIEALEQQRRRLIAALVKIDQEIATERATERATEHALQAPVLYKPVEASDVFGADGDLDSGD
jgi:hypothetical protein